MKTIIPIYSGIKCEVPDESYFVNILSKFNKPFLNKVVTHTNWKESEDGKHPKTYTKLTNEMIENILDSEDPLFMRKVSQDCILSSYFDTIIDAK